MASISAARRYAQAVLELGLAANDLDRWRADLALLSSVWADPQVRAFLEDVRVSKQQRLERVRQFLGNRLGPLALNMVLLLTSRGRTQLIPYIARQFEDLERQREQKVVAQVTVAAPLAADQRDQLAAELARQTGKEVQLDEQVDPRVLSGMVIKIGDQLLDLSVAGRLRRLREQVVGREVAARG